MGLLRQSQIFDSRMDC